MVERSALEIVNLVVAVGARTKMSVAIDHPRKHRRLRQVDHFCAWRNLYIGSRGNALDALILNRNDHVFTNVVAGGIKQAPRQDIAGLGCGLVSRVGRGLRKNDRRKRQTNERSEVFVPRFGVVQGAAPGSELDGFRIGQRSFKVALRTVKRLVADAKGEEGSEPVQATHRRALPGPTRVEDPVPHDPCYFDTAASPLDNPHCV